MFKTVNQEYLNNLQETANKDNKAIVVSALITNRDKIFVQKRSANRDLFPNGWDVVGGHLEDSEGIREALAREIYEETAWRLKEIETHLYSFDWKAKGEEKREFAFIVKVEGDLENPKIERDKHSGFRWIKESEIEILADNKEDMYIYDLVKRAFRQL